MKKALTPILAVIAVIAIIFCFVINGQKGSVQSALDEANKQIETLKTEAATAAETAKTSLDEANAQIETLKADAEKAAADAEEAKKGLEEQVAALTKQIEEAAAQKTEEAKETVEGAADAAAEAAANVTEAAEKAAEEVKVMTHAEYVAAANDDEVVIESYVQDHQSWWDGQVTVYLQDEDGAYFAYNMKCAEEDAAKLVPGQKIRVKGYKGEWAGEVEIMDGTFEIVEADPWIAAATDVTALLATDELINHMNEFVAVKGAKVVAQADGAAFAYKNPEQKSDDLYFAVEVDGATYNFCVESYLRGQDTDVYKAVEALKVGDTVDIEGFLYWYEGANLQATSLTVK